MILWIDDGNEFYFKIDGSFNENSDLTKAVRMKIARKIKEEFPKLEEKLKINYQLQSELSVNLWDDDGQGEKRKRLAQKLGFTIPHVRKNTYKYNRDKKKEL